MKKFKAFLRGFYKNVILKRKFKAFLHLLFDSEYRAQLNHLYDLTKDCTKIEKRMIRWAELICGHKIIYPKYEESLVGKVTPPLRVVQDGEVFRVVDGNHRLLSKCLEVILHDGEIECEVLL